MRFTAILFLTASLVNVAFSYTAKEIDTLQQYLTELKSGLDTINADLSTFSGADGTISQVLQLGRDGSAFLNAVEQANNDIANLPVGDDEDQALVISTLASYYPDAKNAVIGFIDRKPTFDRLAVTSIAEAFTARLYSGLSVSSEWLVAHSPPGLSAEATAVAEQYKALGEKALAAFS